MDNESQAIFDELVKKEPSELTVIDEDFLRARQSYLNKDQKEKFADVLSQPVGQQKEDSVGTSEKLSETERKELKRSLMAEAKDRGLKVINTMSVEMLKAMIDNDENEKAIEQEQAEEAARVAEAEKEAEAKRLADEEAAKTGHKGNFESAKEDQVQE